MAAAGAFSIHNNAFDVRLVLIFGVIGYLLMRFGFPTAPAVLGIVLGILLGPILEQNFRNALTVSELDFMVFLGSPVSAVSLGITVFLFFLWMVPKRRSEKTWIRSC